MSLQCSVDVPVVAELEQISLEVCSCNSAARQLIERGLFPCSPVAPTLAVDLSVLEFVKDLFTRIAPNVTAWTATMEALLWRRKYKLEYHVSLEDHIS